MGQELISLTKNELPQLLNDFGFEGNKKHKFTLLDYEEQSCNLNYFTNINNFLDDIDINKIEVIFDNDKYDRIKKVTVRIFDKLKPDEKYIFNNYKGKVYIFDFKVKKRSE